MDNDGVSSAGPRHGSVKTEKASAVKVTHTLRTHCLLFYKGFNETVSAAHDA